MSGWEGSTADSCLWHEAMASGAVKIPNGKFLLGDAGFPLCDGCLTLYRNVRYHLKEYQGEGRRPQTKEELFNLRHSSLRNVIERCFGVMKSRFKILAGARPFKMRAQARIVEALGVLQNFLLDLNEEEDPGSDSDKESEHGDRLVDGAAELGHEYINAAEDSGEMEVRRNRIATAMWNAYQRRERRMRRGF